MVAAASEACLVNVVALESASGPILPCRDGQSKSALPGSSDVSLLRYRKGIINLDAEVSDGALDFGVAKQELNGSQVACSPVNQRGLGSAE